MKIGKNNFRTIWIDLENDAIVKAIDQRQLPFEFVVEDIISVQQMYSVIKDMHIRGAGLIGASAGYGMYLAALENSSDDFLIASCTLLNSARPTAVNLSWATQRMIKCLLEEKTIEKRIELAKKEAQDIANEDVQMCKSIGEHGFSIIKEISEKKKDVVNILTHCNAGWLAFVDYGTATAPIYEAIKRGIKVHVYVDETRPQNQGSKLTAWELEQNDVPHTIIVDNAGGHLMQHGKIDMCIVGSDRTTRRGDVANKIGTYLKALAAFANDVPFYVALPSSTIDWDISDGIKDIPIEERSANEVKFITGWNNGRMEQVLLCPKNSNASNYAFDVTPAHLVSGLITERGICKADENSLLALFKEKK